MSTKQIQGKRIKQLKGCYYCPVVPELGHYKNEGKYGYDKVIVSPAGKEFVQCVFDTKEERDSAYRKERQVLCRLAEEILQGKGQ